MRRTLLVLAPAVVVAACDAARVHEPDRLEAPARSLVHGQALADQWIVVFDDAVTQVPALARALEAQYGGQLRFVYESALKGMAVRLPPVAIAAIQRNPLIRMVEPDRVVAASGTQTNAPWGLDRIDQRGLPTNTLYQYNQTGAGVTVYVLDTGIQTAHPDFGGRASVGYDVFGGNGQDCDGHGTHVAGTVAGTTWGVAKGAALVAVRVLDCAGSGTVGGAIAGIDWVTQNRTLPAVANMSLGASASSAFDAAVRNSIAAGVTYVVAAGNDAADACSYSPGRTLEALTVGASTSTDQRAWFSNYGSCLDLFAPGASIRSAYLGGGTAVLSGTSMASPHVAGAAALYLETDPTATPAEVTAAILGAATQNVIGGGLSGANNDLLYMVFAGAPAGNQPPGAAFAHSCAGTACNFASTGVDVDGRIVSWAWDFGDGTISALPAPSHTYDGAGGRTVKLTVIDDDGATAMTTVAVPVVSGSNESPTANLRYDCSGLACTFQSKSGDRDGSIVSTRWDFGDGATSGSANPGHTFATAGARVVTLEVMDDDGTKHWQSLQLTVTGGDSNAPPFASLTWTCTGTGCDFRDWSSDPDGSVVAWEWEFGDGSTSTTRHPSHSFPHAGSYLVTLTATDDGGRRHTRTRVVDVTGGPANQSPTAGFTWSCTLLACTFQDTSTDGDGAVVSRAWTFGDGGNASGTNPSHTYAIGGSYTVVLTVTDDDGASDTHSATVMVTAPVTNQPPSASFTSSCAGPICSFVTTATDADGRIVAWSWDLGDGTTSILPAPVHTYPATGTRTVRLTVTDDDGATAVVSVPVNTGSGANVPPTANLRYDCSGLSCTFQNKSGDVDGSVGSQRWEFGDGAGSNGSSPSHTYTAAGTYLVTLEAIDDHGAKNWQAVLLTVAAADSNEMPFASLTSNCTGLTCVFRDWTKDPDGSVVSWEWEFGDGIRSSAQHPTHTFAAAGTYLVTLSVVDDGGRRHSRTRVVTVQ